MPDSDLYADWALEPEELELLPGGGRDVYQPRSDPPEPPPKRDPWEPLTNVPQLAFVVAKCEEYRNSPSPWSATMPLEEQVDYWQRREESVDVETLVALGTSRVHAHFAAYPWRAALIFAGRPVSEWQNYYRQMTEAVHEHALTKTTHNSPSGKLRAGAKTTSPPTFMPRDLEPDQWNTVRGKLLMLHAERCKSSQIARQLQPYLGYIPPASTVRHWLRKVLREQSAPDT